MQNQQHILSFYRVLQNCRMTNVAFVKSLTMCQ